MHFFRVLLIAVCLIIFWHAIVILTGVPHYILPGPGRVVIAFYEHSRFLFTHSIITLIEIISGLVIGTIFGAASALFMAAFRHVKKWLLPLLVISQAIPVFALAPLLVLWLGYGIVSKIAMAILIIFFPVTAAFYDGLRRTDSALIELVGVMNAKPFAVLRHIRIPAAMPSFASGLKVATAVAPIGAVVGEWVGSSKGLGFYMLHANARMQTDAMFAALALIAVIALVLYFSVDKLMNIIVFWQKE